MGLLGNAVEQEEQPEIWKELTEMDNGIFDNGWLYLSLDEAYTLLFKNTFTELN